MIYIDTSALLRLVYPDDTTSALEEFLGTDPDLVSSMLLEIEARRGTLRRAPHRLPRVDMLLGEVETVGISQAVVETASRLPDPMLRSLDAIHLATALLIREDLDALLTYDDRLRTAADSHGLATVAPA